MLLASGLLLTNKVVLFVVNFVRLTLILSAIVSRCIPDYCCLWVDHTKNDTLNTIPPLNSSFGVQQKDEEDRTFNSWVSCCARCSVSLTVVVATFFMFVSYVDGVSVLAVEVEYLGVDVAEFAFVCCPQLPARVSVTLCLWGDRRMNQPRSNKMAMHLLFLLWRSTEWLLFWRTQDSFRQIGESLACCIASSYNGGFHGLLLFLSCW